MSRFSVFKFCCTCFICHFFLFLPPSLFFPPSFFFHYCWSIFKGSQTSCHVAPTSWVSFSVKIQVVLLRGQVSASQTVVGIIALAWKFLMTASSPASQGVCRGGCHELGLPMTDDFPWLMTCGRCGTHSPLLLERLGLKRRWPHNPPWGPLPPRLTLTDRHSTPATAHGPHQWGQWPKGFQSVRDSAKRWRSSLTLLIALIHSVLHSSNICWELYSVALYWWGSWNSERSR